MLQDRLQLSERRACKVTSQPRSTQRYAPRIDDDERRVVACMHELVRKNPRFGYRRIAIKLREEGFRVNDKRVYRLWKQEGFKVPKKPVRKRRLGDCSNGVVRRRATRPNEVWAWDFFHDRLADGRAVKWLACIDEFTRECLLLEARRSIKAKDAVAMLKEVFAKRGAPKHLRSDNGPEFIAKALREFLADSNVQTLYIEPGSPWQNGFAESFNARVKDELIGVEIFTSLLESQVIGGDWKESYNTRRPHSSLDYLTPVRFAESYKHPKEVGREGRPGASQRPPFRSTVRGTNNPETLIVAGS
jgi:transposase InsO family protein